MHDHDWRRYVLRNEGDVTVKEHTQMATEDIPGFYFLGYDCECGVDSWDL